MRRNKVLALGLTGAMAISALAGCGASEGNDATTAATTAGTTGTTAAGDTTAATTEADAEPAQISMLAIDYNGNAFTTPNSDKVKAMYEEYTNTVVNFTWAYNDTYSEKFGLVLADRDNMPMILTANGNMTANIIEAATMGAFWDLTDYMFDSELYPNLSQADKGVCSALTVNGQLIGIYRAREIGRNGLSYRTDWAEAVGITEEPKTIEDIYDMLYKFTYEDPDGNGVDDTYGLEMTKYTGPFDIIQTWFGVGNGWVEKDGDLVPVHETDEYMDALDWIKKCYEEGLFAQNFAEIDTATYSEQCKTGKAGVYIDVMDSGRRIWDYFIQNEIPSVTNADELASMTLLGPVEEKTLATSGFNGFFMITKDGAKTEEDLANCLHFLDKMCDEDMMVLADRGLEDIDWTRDTVDGVEVLVQTASAKEAATSKTGSSSGLNQTVAYIPNTSAKLTLEQTETQLAQADSYVRNREVAVQNPALGYLANSATYAANGTELDDVISTARTQYIAGQITKEQLQEQFQVWNDKGGTQVKEEVNSQFHAE